MFLLRRDWMNLYEGKSQVLLRPQTPQQVSQVLSSNLPSCRASGWSTWSMVACAQYLPPTAHHGSE